MNPRNTQDWQQFKTLREAKDWVMATKDMTDKQAHKWLIDHVPREPKYQEKIMEYLQKQPNTFVWKATQGAYSKSGIPDVCAVIGGRYYGFEIKRPYFGVASEIQKKIIRDIKAAGGKAYIVTYVSEVEEILKQEMGASSNEKEKDNEEFGRLQRPNSVHSDRTGKQRRKEE